MVNDQFGIKMLYPTLPQASDVPKSWFIKDGFRSDDRVRLDESVSGNNNDGYKLDSNEKVRFTICADSKDVDIGCEANFATATSRGYVYKQNDWMAKANSGVEMTAYFKMTQIDESDSTVKGNPIIMKGPTGEHHSNTDCCSGAAHMIHIGGVGESWKNDIAARFSKEMWHVSYHTRSEYKDLGLGDSFLDMGWVGFKYVVYKKTIDNVKSVVVEFWVNENADKQTWKKELTTTDTGGWGDDGDECDGNKDDRLAFGNARMMFRWDHRDGSDVRFKNISIRPIDPNGSFEEEDPETPDTNTSTVSTIRATCRLTRNINSDTGAGCGLTGDVMVWDVQRGANETGRKLCNEITHDFRDIIAERASPTGGSGFQGIVPTLFKIYMKKNGTPAGTCRAKIWNSSGVEKYASVNTITASTLQTSYNLETWDFSTNTYTIQNGDRIGVQYTGTDPDNTVEILCRDPGDGSTGSFYTAFYDDDNHWGDIESRDLCAEIYKAI